MLKLVLVVLAILAAVSAQYISPYYGGYYRSAVAAYPYSYGSYSYGAYAPSYYGGYYYK